MGQGKSCTQSPLRGTPCHCGKDDKDEDVFFLESITSSHGSTTRRSTSRSLKESVPEPGSSTVIAEAVVLCWRLMEDGSHDASDQVLVSFHDEVARCVKAMKAEVLSYDGTSGCVRGFSAEDGSMNAADVAVTFGLNLCGYAVANNINLRIGVQKGNLRLLRLPPERGDRIYCLGEAYAGARSLAAESQKDNMVHLSAGVKKALYAQRMFSFTNAKAKTFYIDPASEVNQDIEEGVLSEGEWLDNVKLYHW
jgi:hypothetical protein